MCCRLGSGTLRARGISLRGTYIPIGGVNRDICTPQAYADDLAAVALHLHAVGISRDPYEAEPASDRPWTFFVPRSIRHQLTPLLGNRDPSLLAISRLTHSPLRAAPARTSSDHQDHWFHAGPPARSQASLHRAEQGGSISLKREPEMRTLAQSAYDLTGSGTGTLSMSSVK